MKQIIVYASLDKYRMYERGLESGLSDEAADHLSYFEEIEITLDIDETTGSVLKAKVTGAYE